MYVALEVDLLFDPLYGLIDLTVVERDAENISLQIIMKMLSITYENRLNLTHAENGGQRA